MPQSLAAVYLHLVFSTKHRRPFLRDVQQRDSIHAYLGATSKTLDCVPVRVGGTEDHVHLLTRMSRTHTIADWVKELKRVTTTWIHAEYPGLREFSWQSGYGVFSVSMSNVDDLVAYIENQAEHHKRMTFQDEFRILCERHGLEIDERYVWD